MAESSASRDSMFPKLTPAQIARLARVGTRRRVAAGEVIFEQGSVRQGVFVVIEGRLEIVSPSGDAEIPITVHQPGEFTGEVSMLAGRRSLVRGRALDDTELL